MVKICKCCSNIDEQKIREVVSESNLEFGCIDQCEQHGGKAFSLVDNILVVKETQEEFLALLR